MSKRNRKTLQRDPFGREVSTYQEEEEDETEDGTHIIPDGGKIRVGLQFMDAIQRDVAKHAPQKLLVSDGTDNPLAMNRPGFRYSTDAAERTAADAALDQAYQEVEQRDANAWLTNDDHPLNSNTRGTSPGKQDAHIDDRASAYAEYDEQQQNAWRR